MTHDVTQEIEAWFAHVGGDGEFVLSPRAAPFAVIGPANSAARMVYTTKPAAVSAAINMGDASGQLGMLGRYGLADAGQLDWLVGVVGFCDLLFLGDMDPVDLMIFARLRARLHPRPIGHLGVSDAYLSKLRLSPAQCHSLPCNPSEAESLSILDDVLPDLAEVVGPACASLLLQRRKIELDAVVTALGSPASLLRPALPAESGS